MRHHKRNCNSYVIKGGDDNICRRTGISAGKWSLGELGSFLVILPVDNTVGRLVFLIGPVDMSMAVTLQSKSVYGLGT